MLQYIYVVSKADWLDADWSLGQLVLGMGINYRKQMDADKKK